MGTLFRSFGNIYWFYGDQKTQFTYPQAGQPGTSGRNFFTGPGYSNLDVVLHKKFPTGEKKFVQFRIEGYNVLNKANYGQPHADLADPQFGAITTTKGQARRLQLALRYQF
jgi:hypothetical protein